jgi:glycosyltransferase involved in cell wall biosynthesis
MTDALVVPLAGDGAEAREVVQRLLGVEATTVVPLSQLAGRANGVRDRRYDAIAVTGAPPQDEVGFSVASLLAIARRPRRIALVDVREQRVVSRAFWRYVAGAGPLAAGQALASGVAFGAQRVAVAGVAVAQPVDAAGELRSILYLRAVVGSTSGVGGAVTHTHEVIRALTDAGVDVQAFTTDGRIAETAAREPEPPCAWNVVRVPRLTKAIPASAAAGGDMALVRAALPVARSVDAIYQRHARFSLAGALLSQLAHKPLILEFNGSEVYKGRYWNPTPFGRRLERCEDAVLKSAALIVVVSAVDRRLLLERGVDPRRVVVNPNGVAADRFSNARGAAVRERYGLGDELVIGFIGSFGPWHGAPVLAEAFVQLTTKLPNARLLLVGGGPEHERTVEILRTAGIEDRIADVGPIAPSDVPDHLDACDILASPHVPLAGGVDFFGSPTKLFEYMAAGKAIVASRLGQIADVLDDGVTALLTTPGNRNELADALGRLAADPALRTELGVAARTAAVERHGWHQNAERLIEAHRRLATAQRS